MFSNREPGHCQHQQHVYTIEAKSLLEVIRIPKSFSLKKRDYKNSYNKQKYMLGSDLYNLFGLVLDLWVILYEELKHELLLRQSDYTVNKNDA